MGTATPVGIPVRYRSTRKTEGLSENSGVPCTEKQYRTRKSTLWLIRLLSAMDLVTLTLRGLGKCGACRPFLGWEFSELQGCEHLLR